MYKSAKWLADNFEQYPLLLGEPVGFEIPYPPWPDPE